MIIVLFSVLLLAILLKRAYKDDQSSLKLLSMEKSGIENDLVLVEHAGNYLSRFAKNQLRRAHEAMRAIEDRKQGGDSPAMRRCRSYSRNEELKQDSELPYKRKKRKSIPIQKKFKNDVVDDQSGQEDRKAAQIPPVRQISSPRPTKEIQNEESEFKKDQKRRRRSKKNNKKTLQPIEVSSQVAHFNAVDVQPEKVEEQKHSGNQESFAPSPYEEQKAKTLLDANAPRSDHQERKEKEKDEDDRFGDYGFFFLEEHLKEEAITQNPSVENHNAKNSEF